MKRIRFHALVHAGLSLALLTGIALMTGCGGSSTPASTPAAPTGTVNVFLSDPPTCSTFYFDVYVTISKIEANENADAGPNDPGWQTLVDLSKSPKQVDLLTLNPDTTQNFCSTLFTLGKGSIPRGVYHEIMLVLLPNDASATVSGNACSTGFNCVDASGLIHPLELQGSSQEQNGDIIIPASQIANGGLTVIAGQSADLNIDFNSCASVLPGSSGQYDLNPVLHAGEVTQTGMNTINGTVSEGYGGPDIDSSIPNAVVLLEQRDNSTTPPTDRVVRATTTNDNGAFTFCPVPSDASNYDLVTAATSVDGATNLGGSITYTITIYNPAVFFNVAIGSSSINSLDFPMTAESSYSTTSYFGPAPRPDLSQLGGTISGQIQTSDSSSGVSGNVQLYALQTVADPNGNSVNVTIPILSAGSTPSGNVTDSQLLVYRPAVTTSSNGGCATSSADCVAYSLIVPPGVPSIGSYSGGQLIFTGTPTANEATYTFTALANGTEGSLNCTSPSGGAASSHSITVTPGSSVTSASQSSLNLDLSGCTAP